MHRSRAADRPTPLRSKRRPQSMTAGRVVLVAIAMSLSFAATPPAALGQSSAPAPDFEQDVLPLLRDHCFKCHGASPKLKGALRITSREGILEGGLGGQVVDLKKPEASRLYHAVAYDEERLRMPPSGKLDDAAAAVLLRWIQGGMPWGKTPDYGVPAEGSGERRVEDPQKGWSYRPLAKPAVPDFANDPDRAFVKNPIDAFVLAKLHENGLEPAKPADRRAFIRRATFDLLGLPPSPEEVEAFVASESKTAVPELVDRLLASPHYGEHWGRHWLDLVRYAETNGFERDSDKPFIWRYRDYVVRAFNEDKRYDRFVQEQIAGDELEDKTSDSVTATGYLRLMQWDDEPPQGPLQARYDVLDDIVKTTGETFLGMTIGCARCHDHKRDPIPQSDYYRFVACFAGLTDYRTDGCLSDVSSPQVKEEADKLAAEIADDAARLESSIAVYERDLASALNGKPAVAGSDPLVRWRYVQKKPMGDWTTASFDASAWKEGRGGFGAPGTPGSLVQTEWHTKEIWLRREFDFQGDPGKFAIVAHHDDDIEVYVNGVLAASSGGYLLEYVELPVTKEGRAALVTGKNVIAVHCRQDGGGQYVDAIPLCDRDAGLFEFERYRSLKRELESVRSRHVPREMAPAAQETGSSPEDTFVLVRGNANVKGAKVDPGVPAVVNAPAFERVPLPQGATSSYRRLALARWITNPSNALTARVIVNRLWQFHFGRGIVRSSSDFGELGTRPTHPELLDWLAGEFIARGYSLKAMHRLIMTSSAYAMSVVGDAKGAAKDPTNDSFWRFEARRLSAEEIRDSMLAVNGEIVDRVGGPPFFPKLPEAVLATSSRPHEAWGESPAGELGRRSLYIKVKRSLLPPMLTVFDSPDVDASCPVRFTTTQPTQALALLNSPDVHRGSRACAKRLLAEAGDDDSKAIDRLYRLALARSPSPTESDEARDLLLEQRVTFHRDREAALQRLCLFVFNTNEFIYVD